MSFSDGLKGRLDLLPSLLAILEEKSVSRAANRMGVTQPAMSRSLAQLRELLNDRLLERTGTETHLTPRAEALLPAVRSVLIDAHHLFQPDHFNPETTEICFRIALPDVIAQYALPDLLAAFQSEAPNASLQLVSYREAPNSPHTEDLHFAITAGTNLFPGWPATRLYNETDVLVHREPLEKGTDPLSQPHIAVIAPGEQMDPVDKWLESTGYERLISVNVPSYTLATELIATTGNVAILPKRLARHLAATRNMLWTDYWTDQTAVPVFMLHPPRLEDDPAAVWIRNLALKVFRAL